MNMRECKDASDMPTKRFENAPLAKQLDQSSISKPIEEYDKSIAKRSGRDVQEDNASIKNKQDGLDREHNVEQEFENKVEKQEQEINDVESGKKDFDRSNTKETGNYGEMKTDQDLRSKGYERISEDMVTDIDENGHQGIDGIYYNPDGKPQYIIVDAKYGSAQLNPDTKDGKQMSENWIDKRLDQSVGKEKADEIRLEKLLNSDNVGTYVAHVDENGNVRYDKLDNRANVVEKDVKINA